MNINEQANFVWSIADLLRGDFKQSEYGKVILPFTVLRRFDCVLAPSKEKILEINQTLSVSNKAPILRKYTGHNYYNISKFDFEKLTDDSTSIETNLRDYINGFSEDVKEIMDSFEIFGVIEKLNKAGLLYLIVQKFANIDMSADAIDNLEMGYMFEELIRKFSEQSNETAGEHFTPREVIELMVEILFDPDMREIANTDGKIYTVLDPACGTGGMLSVAQNTMWNLNTTMKVIPFGQELNPETYATCKSDMILKGNNNSRIVLGNSFNEDGFKEQKFDYMLSNPPFGVEWKKVETFIKNEASDLGFDGRFGAGTPRISDGSLLFLQHMISKMNAPKDGGSRIAIVFNGSPLFTGDAGSGESEIRRWIIEKDMLEAIVALPDQLFYNTGISTYIWVLTNRKDERRKGKIRLVNGVSYFEKMRKSLGNKRNLISESNRKEIVRLYSTEAPDENYIDFDNEDFGYRKITVERPAYDKHGKAVTDKKGNKKADASLRDTETVPLKEDIHTYFDREVLPHVPDAWIDEDKTKIGYEIPVTRCFYKLMDENISSFAFRKVSELQAEISDVLYRLSCNSRTLFEGLSREYELQASPIDWIEKTPKHWKIVRAKNVFAQRISKGNNVLIQLAATQKYGMYPQEKLDGVVQVKEDTDFQTFKTVHQHDFVISLRSFQGGFEMSDYEGVCSPAYQVFYGNSKIYPPYFKKVFKSTQFIDKINSLTVGIREGKNILYKDFSEIYIAIPPIDEQKQIVEYIDKQMGTYYKDMCRPLEQYIISTRSEGDDKGGDYNQRNHV